MIAGEFLSHLIQSVTYTILTDNGIQFTNQKKDSYAFHHIFDRICKENKIKHRLTRVCSPWTNGQVERMNQALKEATIKKYHYHSHEQLKTHIKNFVNTYNFEKRLKTLKGLTTYEEIIKCWKNHPELFKMNPSHLTMELNTFCNRKFREQILKKTMGKTAFIILKIVERCNLNCSYCYFFNGGDESYKKHPPFISSKIVQQLSQFIFHGVRDLGLSRVEIIFHGGEPMLQPLRHFDEMCKTIQKDLSDSVQIDFKIQTNGTLVSEKWIDVFSKYGVSVRVSLDGPKEYHDVFRLDHRGCGSYNAVKSGIHLLQKGAKEKRIAPIGILCIIDPKRSAKTIYRHVVDDLKISKMDFLLPERERRRLLDDDFFKWGDFS